MPRPFKIRSKTILQNKIDKYFETQYVLDLKENKIVFVKPLSRSGLCNFLWITQTTLNTYLTDENPKRQGVRETLAMALQKIEESLVDNGLMSKTNSAMSMFVLKNNFNRKDKAETEIHNSGEIQFKIVD